MPQTLPNNSDSDDAEQTIKTISITPTKYPNQDHSSFSDLGVLDNLRIIGSHFCPSFFRKDLDPFF